MRATAPKILTTERCVEDAMAQDGLQEMREAGEWCKGALDNSMLTRRTDGGAGDRGETMLTRVERRYSRRGSRCGTGGRGGNDEEDRYGKRQHRPGRRSRRRSAALVDACAALRLEGRWTSPCAVAAFWLLCCRAESARVFQVEELQLVFVGHGRTASPHYEHTQSAHKAATRVCQDGRLQAPEPEPNFELDAQSSKNSKADATRTVLSHCHCQASVIQVRSHRIMHPCHVIFELLCRAIFELYSRSVSLSIKLQ